MKKNNKFYIMEVIILIFILVLGLLYQKISDSYAYLVNIIFWFLFMIVLLIKGGFPRDRNYYKKSSIKITLIVLLFYILVIYLLGLFIGFVKNLYFYDVVLLIKKVLPIALFIVASEVSRYLFFKHGPNKVQIVIFTLELIILNIMIGLNNYNVTSIKQLFIIVSCLVIPIIVSEITCSYVTYNVGLMPTIIYKLLFNLYSYLVPFNPDLGDYLNSIFGISVPYVIYFQIRRCLKYNEKYGLYAKRTVIGVFSSILLIFLVVMVLLISGIFKYQLIAIATGSMEPVYYRGDAVIYEKVDPTTIEVGDILVYRTSGGVVTHRVVEIVTKNNTRLFRTKGDNNSTKDNIDILESDVNGVVKYIVKYVGFPTILLNELLESK